MPSYAHGDEVEVNWDGKWRSARVEDAKGNGLYCVDMGRGQKLFIHERDIKGYSSPAQHENPIRPPRARHVEDFNPEERDTAARLSRSPFESNMELAYDLPTPAPVDPKPRPSPVDAAKPIEMDPAHSVPLPKKTPLRRSPLTRRNSTPMSNLEGQLSMLGVQRTTSAAPERAPSGAMAGHRAAFAMKRNPFSRHKMRDNSEMTQRQFSGIPQSARGDEDEAQSMVSYRPKKSGVKGKPKARKKHDQSPAVNVKKCLQLQVKRMHVYRGMPFYLLYLIFLTTAAALLYCGSTDESTFRATDAVSKNLLGEDDFREISSPDDFYDWLRGVSNNFWVAQDEYAAAAAREGFTTRNNTILRTHRLSAKVDSTPSGFFAEHQNVPLYYLLVRQRRVKAEPCSKSEQAQPIERLLWDRMRRRCYPDLERGTTSDLPFRTNSTMMYPYSSITTDPFSPDSLKSNMPPMRETRAVTDTYESTKAMFTLKLPYDVIYREDVLKIIDDLETNAWIDFGTRLIVVETMTYNPTTETYQLVRFSMEVKGNGATTQDTLVEPFWFMHITGHKNRALFAFDIMFTLYLIWALKELFWSVFLNRRLGTDMFGFWELVTVLNLTLILLSLVLKFIVWQRSMDFSDHLPAQLLYSRLGAFHATFYSAKDLFIASFWVGWMRLLEYLRYNSRLNAVTETIRLSFSDLVSLLIISFFIIVSFGVTANMIYGWQFAEFATIGDSISWLLRTVFSGDLDPFDGMMGKEPTWTPIFLVTFLILSWLILLNVVLGILAAGFNAALKSTNDREWNIISIQKDIRALMTDIFYSDEKGEKELPASRSSLPAYHRKRLLCVAVVDEILQERLELHEETQADIMEEYRKDFNEESVVLTALLLMNRSGWMLSREETIEVLIESKNLVADSFASAEAAKQAEKEQLLDCINQVGERLHDAIESTVYTAFTTLDERLTVIEQTMEGEFVRTKADITESRHNLNDRMDMTEAKHTEETNRVIGAVCGHRKQLDSIAASIFDSESRVRGDIQRRPEGGAAAPISPGKVEQWRRQLELREARLVEREKQLLANLNMAKERSSPNRTGRPSNRAPVFIPHADEAELTPPPPRAQQQVRSTRIDTSGRGSATAAPRHRDPLMQQLAEGDDGVQPNPDATQDSDDSGPNALE